MTRKVLIVDDDRIMLHRVKKQCETHKDSFSLAFAENGLEAVDVLKEETISLVVTDLQMPEMDGFELLAYLSEHYPDIPVIIQTAYSSPQFRRAVLEGGAAGYMEKPIEVEDLAQEIITALEEETEGETLQSVPLEMYVRLIEMEQKTCTIRVEKKSTEEQGRLFFKDGELVDARVDELQGISAAHEIFSWEETPYSIQDSCPVDDKKIDGGLAAALGDV